MLQLNLPSGNRTARLGVLFLSCSFSLHALYGSEPSNANRMNSAKVVGHESCMKCHGQELAVWKTTPHFTTFKEMHKRPEAQAIADRMGLRSIKRGGLCIQCHYTEKMTNGKPKAIAGVSCESCHGAAADWIALHNDYGGPTVTKSEETPEHRLKRLEDSIRHGMRNPANLYLIARSCLNCHTVPNEKLVNVGGHVAGSGEFELVAWSQGKVRHNFLRGNGSNAAASPQRLRLMYLVGQMTDLEFSLRATAEATSVATYGVTSAHRVFELRKRLAKIQESIQDPNLEAALEAAYSVKLKSNNSAPLQAAAERVGKATYRIAEGGDASSFGAIDAYLPSRSDYKN